MTNITLLRLRCMYIRKVRKISAIFFLTVVLVSQTPLQQVLRIPLLISHFQEHNSIQNNISFIEFIRIHYLSGHPVDDDFDRDEQLPFRSADIVVLTGAVVIPPLAEPGIINTFYRESHYQVMDQNSAAFLHSADIWQPPRTC